MTALPYITDKDVAGRLNWPDMVQALAAGHRLPRAQIGDLFLTRGDDTLMGGLAVLFQRHADLFDRVEPELTLQGLARLYATRSDRT